MLIRRAGRPTTAVAAVVARRARPHAPAIGVAAISVFAVVAIILFCLHGSRLVITIDEGIILDAAARMLHGQTLYRDFFGYMSPGSYWLQEAAFSLLGVSVLAGRVPVILDFAVGCALLFWIVARLAGRKAAFLAVFLFFAFQATAPELLLAQHRMDSAAISLASIVLCIEGRRYSRPAHWIAAGVLIAAGAVCTPSVALFAPATLIWLCADRSSRRFAMPYCGGLCAGALVLVAILAASGLLTPLVEQMAWLGRNYSSVNVMPYGSMNGGYLAALEAATGIDRAIRILMLFCIALPAVLPVLAAAAWAFSWARDNGEREWAAGNAVPYLLGCMVIYVATTYPRADVGHLRFVAVLSYALSVVWIVRHVSRRVATGVAVFSAMCAGVFLAQAASGLRAEVAVKTPVGTLRAAPSDAAPLQALLKAVRPRDSLYVHPYMPLLYFLTQSENPTPYSYLAPGMMTRTEEFIAMEALQESPPQKVMYLSLPRSEFLRVFPHAKNLDHRFPILEAWIMREYAPAEPPVSVGGYRLYERTVGAGPIQARVRQ